MKFEIFKDKRGDWRWRLKAKNGEIVAQSEGYVNKQDCLDTVGLIMRDAHEAEIKFVTV